MTQGTGKKVVESIGKLGILILRVLCKFHDECTPIFFHKWPERFSLVPAEIVTSWGVKLSLKTGVNTLN